MPHRMSSRPRPGAGGELTALMQGVSEGAVTRREFVVKAAGLGLSLTAVGAFLASCGSSGPSSVGSSTSAPAMDTSKPAKITVCNWTGYIDQAMLRRFEREQGIKIEYVTFTSNEQLLSRMNEGRVYDVIFPEEWAAEVLIKAGKLRALDMDLLPNFKNVTDPSFRDPPYDPGTGGKKYTAVYFFGTEGFAARLDKINDPGESWAIMYDAQYRGKMTMLDGSREILGPALLTLGYGLNTTDQDELDRATTKALGQKRLVRAYDSVNQATLIRNGQPLTECWDGDAVDAMNKVGISTIRYVLPKEGYMVWSDAPSIPVNAPSPYGAHLFLDFLMEPSVAAANADSTGYQPVVAAADPLMKSLVQRAMRPTSEQIAGGTFPRDLGDFNAAFDEAYKKIVG